MNMEPEKFLSSPLPSSLDRILWSIIPSFSRSRRRRRKSSSYFSSHLTLLALEFTYFVFLDFFYFFSYFFPYFGSFLYPSSFSRSSMNSSIRLYFFIIYKTFLLFHSFVFHHVLFRIISKRTDSSVPFRVNYFRL